MPKVRGGSREEQNYVQEALAMGVKEGQGRGNKRAFGAQETDLECLLHSQLVV